MSDNLVERVARAMSRIDWCGAKIGDEFCLCDDPRLPHEVRAGECFCRMKAPAAIAVVLEEAARVAEGKAVTAAGDEYQSDKPGHFWDRESIYGTGRSDAAAAIRALKEKP